MNSLKYTAAYSLPLAALLGVSIGGWWTYLTPVYAFVAIPILELLLPQDSNNLTVSEREKEEINSVYDIMLYANVFIVFGLIWFVGNLFLSKEFLLYEWIGVAFSLGIVLGTNGINVGHELGHRQQSWERYLGKALLLPTLYMHFYIEHNFGHHMHAATAEDPATARRGQSVYSFWFTSVFRQYVSAWKIQLDLLKRQSRPFLSVYNDMLWFSLIQLLYLSGLFLLFGPYIGFLLLASGFIGVLLLESVNYIEHYGLLRNKLPSGRYERVRAIHSWNSNHIVGRIVLYELTRHSDHHYKSSKKYQTLDFHEQSPEMPYGYPTSLVIALFPPLWFRIMNPRIPQEMKAG